MKRSLDDWYHLYHRVSENAIGLADNDIACWTRGGATFSRKAVLSILHSSADEWNNWHQSVCGFSWYRLRNREAFWIPDSIISLQRADLKRRSLTGRYLAGIDFTGSSFVKSDLTGCDFHNVYNKRMFVSAAVLNRADFRSCNLASTNFDYVEPTHANFSSAELNGASLRSAKLAGSKFYRTLVAAAFNNTELRDCVFRETYFMGSSFVDTDLSATKTLSQAHYYPPVTLDMRTLLRSGKMPKELYRAAGLTDRAASRIMALSKDLKTSTSCFISYSARDESFARSLHAELEKAGIRTWFAPRDLEIEARTRVSLDKAVQEMDKLIVILSKSSVRSHWVEQEVETAFERERANDSIVLYPVRIDDAVMKSRTGWAAHLRRTRNIGHFTGQLRGSAYFNVLGHLVSSLDSK